MIRRTSIFLVICAVLLMGVMQIAKAQDEAPAVSGFILLSGTSGTLEEGDDDVYELTLEEVRPNAVWVLNAPQYFSGWYDTALLASHWAANTETPLTATVLLQTETVTLRMTASQPAYDPMLGTLTLQVSAVEAFPVEEEKGK
ncbi:MAG TPA: hypothetical protein VHL10_06735, partial [Nitrososphaera sp.]|nr:hypothetical protein [Nitrososphaera sp.]